MKYLLQFTLLTSLLFAVSQVSAIQISLDPTPDKVHPPENLFVDINISGLQSGNVDTLLGAFSLDLLYDPTVLSPIISASTPGTELGDVTLGEAIWDIDTSVAGVVGITEVSLLEASSTSCIFCDLPFLEDLQSDSFTLATMAFFAFDAPSGPVTFLDTDNVVLSDTDGFEATDVFGKVASVATPILAVKVPEPGMFSLMALGMFGMLFSMQRRAN